MSAPEIISTYPVVEFAHLLDVSVGVNLAYSLLRQVHTTWTRAYGNMIAVLCSDFDKLVEPGSDNTVINDYVKKEHKSKLRNCEKVSQFVVRIMRIWGFLAAGLLMLSLGVIGFNPEMKVSLCVIYTCIALLVAPIPVSSSLLLIYWKYQVWRANRKLNNRLKEITTEMSSAKGNLGIVK